MLNSRKYPCCASQLTTIVLTRSRNPHIRVGARVVQMGKRRKLRGASGTAHNDAVARAMYEYQVE